MKKASKIVKALIIMLLLILLILVVIGAIGAYYFNDKLSKVNYEFIDKTTIDVNEGVDLEQKGFRNIAIFGVDSRADTYDDTRSDCIMIASINEQTNDVKLVSVYRDTYVNIDGHGLDKITHAFAFGNASLAMSTLNKNLDLDIKEYVAVNFGAVVDIINQVGGVEISIDSAELEYINKYIRGIDEQEGTTTAKITKTGKQKLNGVQALAYSRIRYTSGGDYKRTERMRDVLMATFDKVKTLNVTQMNKLLNNILPEISTNITLGEMEALIPKATTYNMKTDTGWPYEVKGITLDRWYGVPVTLESNVVKLHKEIFGENDYEATETVKSISQSIIKKTGYGK